MIALTTADGVVLEGRWDVPPHPERALVFCHPHPLHRGTMTAPLMVGVTRHLVAAGFAVLRFNFRGVGNSEGRHDYGVGELDDVQAAIDLAAAAHPSLPLCIAGWSFGAATALVWQAETHSTIPYAGIAPPVDSERAPRLPDPGSLRPAQRTFVLGDRDQFVAVDELRAYADGIGAHLEVLRGSDHFFYFREDRVAAAVAAALA